MTTLVVVIALETRIREGIADFMSVYRYIAKIYYNNTIWRPLYHDNTIYDFHITILKLVGHIYHIVLFILCSTLSLPESNTKVSSASAGTACSMYEACQRINRRCSAGGT